MAGDNAQGLPKATASQHGGSYAEGPPHPKDLQCQALAGPERRGKASRSDPMKSSQASHTSALVCICALSVPLSLLPLSLPLSLSFSLNISVVQDSHNGHWEAGPLSTYPEVYGVGWGGNPRN